MKPSTTNELFRDPLKLSLMNPDNGGCHLTRCFEIVGEEEDPLK